MAPRIDEHKAHNERRKDKVDEVNGESETHDPCRKRGADVGSHDDGDGLGKRQQTGIDKRDGHHRGGRRGLYGARYERSGEHTGETVGGHGAEDMAQLRSGHLLQGFTHYFHAIDQKCQRTDNLQKNTKIIRRYHM